MRNVLSTLSLLLCSLVLTAASPAGDSSFLVQSIDVGYPIIALDYNPNGTLLAVGGGNKTIDIYQPALGIKTKTFKGHDDDILAIRFSPDNRLLATGGVDKKIIVWDVATETNIMEMRDHKDYVRDLAWSPDGRFLASASWDGTAILWEAGTGRAIHKFKHEDNVTSVSFSPDGNKLMTACGDHKLYLWDVKKGIRLYAFDGHTDEIWDVKWSPGSNLAASGGWDNKARIWNVGERKQVMEFPGHVTDVWSVAFSPEGIILATSGGDRTIKLWDLSTGNIMVELAKGVHTSDVEEVAFNPDGETLVSCGRDGFLHFWEVPDMDERFASAIDIALEKWSEKSPYEKTKDYEKRMARKAKKEAEIRREMEQKLSTFYERNVNWDVKFQVGDYNADLEYFVVQSPSLGNLRLIVKPSEAPLVAENVDRLELRDLDIDVVDGNLVVKEVTGYIKGLNRRYKIKP